MAQKTEGIQQLLMAEKKATEKVSEARKRKAQKLKTAKKDADQEITKFKSEKENHYKAYEQELFNTLIKEFKSEKENHYKAYEQEVLGKKSDSEAQIQVQTNQKIKDLDVMMKNNKSKALTAIHSILFDIDIKLHENVKL